MKRILMASSAFAVVAGSAFAGGYTTPVTEAPVVAPAPVVTSNVDWTGFYAGGQLGYGKTNSPLDVDGAYAGVHGGYLKDFGSYVLGGEFAYSGASMKTGKGATEQKVKDFADLKLIAGIPTGKWLPYAGLGASYVDAKSAGTDYSDTVPMALVGVKYQLNDKWALGGELDYRKGNNFDGTKQDLNLTTVGMTASYRF